MPMMISLPAAEHLVEAGLLDPATPLTGVVKAADGSGEVAWHVRHCIWTGHGPAETTRLDAALGAGRCSRCSSQIKVQLPQPVSDLEAKGLAWLSAVKGQTNGLSHLPASLVRVTFVMLRCRDVPDVPGPIGDLIAARLKEVRHREEVAAADPELAKEFRAGSTGRLSARLPGGVEPLRAPSGPDDPAAHARVWVAFDPRSEWIGAMRPLAWAADLVPARGPAEQAFATVPVGALWHLHNLVWLTRAQGVDGDLIRLAFDLTGGMPHAVPDMVAALQAAQLG